MLLLICIILAPILGIVFYTVLHRDYKSHLYIRGSHITERQCICCGRNTLGAYLPPGNIAFPVCIACTMYADSVGCTPLEFAQSIECKSRR